MDPSKGKPPLKIPFDTKKILGFKTSLDELAPGQRLCLAIAGPFRVDNEGGILSEDQNKFLSEASEVEDTEYEGTDYEEENLSMTTPNPSFGNVQTFVPSSPNQSVKLAVPFTFKRPSDFKNSSGSTSTSSGIKFSNYNEHLAADSDSETHQSYPVSSLKPLVQPLTQEKVIFMEDHPEYEFTRKAPSQMSFHKSNPFSEDNIPLLSTSESKHEMDPKENFGWDSKQNSEVPGRGNDITGQEQEPSTSAQKSQIDPAKAIELDRVSMKEEAPLVVPPAEAEPSTPTVTWADPLTISKEITPPHLNVLIYQNNPFIIPRPNSGAAATSNAISKATMNKKDMAALWDYKPRSPKSFPNCEVDSGNVDAMVSHILQQSSSKHHSLKSDSEDENQPPPNAHQEHLGLGRKKSQFFNPGININFNYNPVFSADTAWTWNHQQPPRALSAYFPPETATNIRPEIGTDQTDDVKSPPYLQTDSDQTDDVKSAPYMQTDSDQTNDVKSPPYLQEVGSTLSEISLVPMVSSADRLVTSPEVSGYSLEDSPSESDFELPKSKEESTTISKKVSTRKFVDTCKEGSGSTSPVGCRIVEILNQFNKLDEDDSGKEGVNESSTPTCTGDSPANESRTSLGESRISSINTSAPTFTRGSPANESRTSLGGSRISSVNTSAPTCTRGSPANESRTSLGESRISSVNTSSRPSQSGLMTGSPRTTSEQRSVSKSRPHISTEIKRNIVKENIILAKYSNRSPSARSVQPSLPSYVQSHPAFIPIIVKTPQERKPVHNQHFYHLQSHIQAQARAEKRVSRLTLMLTGRKAQPQPIPPILPTSQSRASSLSRNPFRGTIIDVRNTLNLSRDRNVGSGSTNGRSQQYFQNRSQQQMNTTSNRSRAQAQAETSARLAKSKYSRKD